MSSLNYRILILIFLLPTFVNAKESNKIVFQYAGEIGKYSVGFEREITSIYSISAHYGVVPPDNLNRKIETYTVKNNLKILNLKFKKIDYKFYFGLGLFHVPGNKYKTHEIEGVEDNYYRQSSLRGLIYLGHEVKLDQRAAIYLESGINDIWIINSINNDTIDYKNYVSLGIGFKHRF